MRLGEESTEQGIIARLGKIKQRTGNTRTDLALEMLRTQMFSRGSIRPHMPQVGLVITDGDSDYPDKTRYQAQLAKRIPGITILAIGVGK